MSREPPTRIKRKQLVNEIETFGGKVLEFFTQETTRLFNINSGESGHVRCIGPIVLVGGATETENFGQLFELGLAGQNRFLVEQFCENTANAPHVNARTVHLSTE